jgi:hypothetical protein
MAVALMIGGAGRFSLDRFIPKRSRWSFLCKLHA